MFFLVLAAVFLTPNANTKISALDTCKTPDSYILMGDRAAVLHDNIVIDLPIINGKAISKTTCYKLETAKNETN